MASATPATVARPRTVSAASYTLYGLATAPVLFAAVQLALLGDLKRAAESAYAGTDMAPTAGADAASLAITGLASSVFTAIVLAALGFFCGKGKNWARIIVWIFAAGRVLTIPGTVPIFRDGFLTTKPAWYLPMTLTSIAITLAGFVTVSILLALPVSRPFFRKPDNSQLSAAPSEDPVSPGTTRIAAPPTA